MLNAGKRLIVLAVMGMLLAGCDPMASLNHMGGMFNPRHGSSDQTDDVAMNTPERDPVDLKTRGEIGIEPIRLQAPPPGQIGHEILAPTAKGVTQQTFTEAGGVHGVSLDMEGKRLIYASTQWSRTPQICIQGITSKAVMRVTDDRMSDMMPRFDPKGEEIVWCSNRYGSWDILVKDSGARPGMRPRQLTRSSDDDVHPTWSVDKRFLAFSRFNQMDGNWQIWVMDYQKRTLSYVTEGLFPEFKPVAEMGERGKPRYTLVYQRARARDMPWYSIWTISLQMGENGAVEAVNAPTEIVADSKWAAINPSWSPDGNYIAFASVHKSVLGRLQARIYKADDVWVVRADGTDLTQITSHPAPDWDPYWAKDPADPTGSGRIYFISERSGHPNVYSVRPIIPGMEAAEARAMAEASR